MNANKFIIAILLGAFVASIACTPPDKKLPAGAVSDAPTGMQVPVTIDTTLQKGTLNERYIGFALDTAQITGGKWWDVDLKTREVAETPDLESEKLRTLAASLSPSLLRIGGTDCDGAYFCPEEGDCELPPQYADAFIDKENRKPGYFTHADIRRVADFAEAIGARVMFCINVGAGPRDQETGAWLPDNARLLIDYINSLPNGDLFDIWEPGNEVNSISFHFNVPQYLTAEFFAQDLVTFKALIDEADPGGLVATPGDYFYPSGDLGDFTEQLMPLVGDTVDILTWHLYATQSDRCGQNPITSPYPSSKETLFDEDVVALHRYNAQYSLKAADGRPTWNGESASGQCGGQVGVSDTLMDALWTGDWLGIMSEEGTELVVRQTLVGSDYGIIDPVTYDPRPTLLALAMFRRTVHKARLDTAVDRGTIKAHAFCNPQGATAITVVLANPNDEMFAAPLELGVSASAGQQFTLTSADGIAADRATIEGLATGDDGVIPDPEGTPIYFDGKRPVVALAANSLVFAVIELDAPSPVCR